MRISEADVVVIGGGVIGAAIAMRVSLTDARVCLLEAAGDLAEGATKGNGGVTTSGHDAPPGTLEAELITASIGRWDDLCERLDVPYRRVGALPVAVSDEQVEGLKRLHQDAVSNGVECRYIDGDEARTIEPMIAPACRAALWVPSDGIIDPMRLTIACAELAARNGAEICRRSPVIGFETRGDRLSAVHTPEERIRARFVVNASGLFADDIDALAGADKCRMWPRRGQYWVLDRAFGSRLKHVVAPVPDPEARGVSVVPTTNGSVLVGPTAEDREDRWDKSTDRGGREWTFALARKIVPSVSEDYVIKSFAALRPASDDVYRVRSDSRIRNLVHATGIRSTGVSSSPAVADRVFDLLCDAGFEARARSLAETRLPRVPRFAFEDEPSALSACDSRYGQIVCACEQVSAAEIAAALEMRVGARSINGVRKRTRATGGRCQGSVCMAGVAFLCSLHMGVPPGEVPLNDDGGTLGMFW